MQRCLGSICRCSTGAIILARNILISEDLNLGLVKSVTIKVGYAPNYVARPGNTLLQGKLTMGKGSMVTDRLTVK